MPAVSAKIARMVATVSVRFTGGSVVALYRAEPVPAARLENRRCGRVPAARHPFRSQPRSAILRV
ncbi:predicted protein [Mycobacterium tuberculosis T17]|nr:predicted protein [Mycobacterium tuberculosis T17]